MTQLLGTESDELVLDPSWWSWAGAHGGLLVAEAVRHAVRALEIPPGRGLRSVSVQLLSTVGPEPVRLAPSVLRHGGTATSVALRADQGGEPKVVGHAVFGASRPHDVTAQATAAPRVVPPESAPPVPGATGVVPFSRHFEFRSADGSMPLVGAEEAQLTAWFRMIEPTAVDAAQAVMLLDAMAPAVFARLHAPVAVPTLDFAVHVHAPLDEEPVPPGGWLLGRQRAVSAADGWEVDDGTLWDQAGRLLATARQLRRVL